MICSGWQSRPYLPTGGATPVSDWTGADAAGRGGSLSSPIVPATIQDQPAQALHCLLHCRRLSAAGNGISGNRLPACLRPLPFRSGMAGLGGFWPGILTAAALGGFNQAWLGYCHGSPAPPEQSTTLTRRDAPTLGVGQRLPRPQWRLSMSTHRAGYRQASPPGSSTAPRLLTAGT